MSSQNDVEQHDESSRESSSASEVFSRQRKRGRRVREPVLQIYESRVLVRERAD